MPRSGAQTQWPSRDEVLAFADRADEAVVEALDAGGFTDAAIVRPCTGPRRCIRRSSTKRCTRRRCSTCGIACRTSRSGSLPGSGTSWGDRPDLWRPASAGTADRPHPGRRRATLGADRDRDHVRVGQRVRRASRGRRGVRHRRAQGHQRGLPRVRRGRRLSRQLAVVARELGVGAAGEAGAPDVLDPRVDSRCQ